MPFCTRLSGLPMPAADATGCGSSVLGSCWQASCGSSLRGCSLEATTICGYFSTDAELPSFKEIRPEEIWGQGP